MEYGSELPIKLILVASKDKIRFSLLREESRTIFAVLISIKISNVRLNFEPLKPTKKMKRRNKLTAVANRGRGSDIIHNA